MKEKYKRIQLKKMRFANGDVCIQVDKDRYLLSEAVRNYVLSSVYELNTPKWLACEKASLKYNVSLWYVKTAIKEWRGWFYGSGIRHKPIELLIKENEIYKS